MTNRLGIETISAFGMPPVEYVNLAADLGCAHISTGLYPIYINPHGYASFNLREDAVLRRAMNAAMRDRGVSISLAEGLTVKPNIEARDRAAEFDAFADLGVRRINTVSLDPDMGRTLDQFAVTVEMAARSGSGPADLAALDPALIGYVQLSDAPLVSKFSTYTQEAMTERLVPGQGELPLLAILKAVRRDCVVSLEVPLLSQAEAGIGPHDRLRPAVAAARELLERI